jgi:hypothetical protein
VTGSRNPQKESRLTSKAGFRTFNRVRIRSESSSNQNQGDAHGPEYFLPS